MEWIDPFHRDVMDGGSGNDELHLVIEPRLLRPTLELDYSNLSNMGAVTDPADEMTNAVSIESFDLIGRDQDHEDIVMDAFDEGSKVIEDFKDTLVIDKDKLMNR